MADEIAALERQDTVFCDDRGLWVRDPLGNCRPFDINDYESTRDERRALEQALREIENGALTGRIDLGDAKHGYGALIRDALANLKG